MEFAKRYIVFPL